MSASAATLERPAIRSTGLTTSTLIVAKRTILKFVRTPQLVVLGTIQGAMFLLIFRYVFGGAIAAGNLRYVDFLVPGFVTTGILFGGMGSAVVVAEDMQQGLIDRLRSLPIPRSAVLTGRAVADTGVQIYSLIILSLISFGVGFRLHAPVSHALLAFALIVAFSVAFEWLFIFLGMMSGNPQAAQGTALLVFPFTFISSAYVPVSTMPGWMQAIAHHQPITPMVDAVRALTQGQSASALLGHSASHYVWESLIWSVGLTIMFGVLAVARYRKG
jgi:ABC-2 type transport system permease protein